MTFKALMLRPKGPIGAVSKEEGARAPLEFFAPWTIWGPSFGTWI